MGRPIYPADDSRVKRLERQIGAIWLMLTFICLFTGCLALSLLLN